MESKPKQDYSYAIHLDSGNLVHVDQAKREEIYVCPCCGFEMRPHMGKVRRWHFTHKADANCNYETYLHKVAKTRIQEAFLDSENFLITYNPKHYCASNCPLKYVEKCSTRKEKTFDLRQFYDTCDEEKEYKGFIPDLMLRSSSKPELPPVFLEIYVTHKSTNEKRKSGFRIIEIPIRSEDDITAIVRTKHIRGIDSNDNLWYGDRSANIKFFNFNKQYEIEESDDFEIDDIHVFQVLNNGYFRTGLISCRKIESLDELEGDIIISNFSINWLWAFAELQKRGVTVVNCIRCQFYKSTMLGEKICVLYKKYGTPKSPKIYEAKRCSHYWLTDRTEDGAPIDSLAPGNFMDDYADPRDFDKPVFVEFRIQNKNGHAAKPSLTK